jgi:hypothetical protein
MSTFRGTEKHSCVNCFSIDYRVEVCHRNDFDFYNAMMPMTNRQRPLLLSLLFAVLFVCLASIFGPTLLLVQHHDEYHAMDVRQIHSDGGLLLRSTTTINGGGALSLLDLPDLIQLPHESLVWSTIKSCIPANDDADSNGNSNNNGNNNAKTTTTKNKCHQFIPDPPPPPPLALPDTNRNDDGESHPHPPFRQQRIGLLSPPGTLSQSLLNRVHQLAHAYNKKVKQQHHTSTNGTSTMTSTMTEIAVIATSHIPPYGYGKNHGYTKLIRYVPNPLLLQVLDALSWSVLAGSNESSSSSSSSSSLLDEADVIAATRLVLRWHCRVSHIAAHTAVLSIPMLDFITLLDAADGGDAVDGESITDGAITDSPPSSSSSHHHYEALLKAFVQSSPLNSKMEPFEQASQQQKKQQQQQQPANEESVRTGDDAVLTGGDDDDNDNNDDHRQDDDRLGMVEATWSHAHRILDHLGGVAQLVRVLDAVILDELARSQNFTSWPCPSFWAVSPPLSKVGQRLARALSPDCDDPYVHCFVARDQCEFRGDAECRPHNNNPQ